MYFSLKYLLLAVALSESNIRLIFGLKIRQLRSRLNLSQGEFAARCGLSPSYINEIEKAKKSPSTKNILKMAGVLGVSYESLVSPKLDKNLAPVSDLLHSGFLDSIPLKLFKVEVAKVVEMIADAPGEVNAFISTLLKISRNYEMSREHFYFAALRSYQELKDNHFEEIETAVEDFAAETGLDISPPMACSKLHQILASRFGYRIENTLDQHPDLKGFRSVFIPETRRLLINSQLSETQKSFLLGREIAFNVLEIQERPLTTSIFRLKSFDMALNNFKASYFSVALLMNREELTRDLKTLFAMDHWDPGAFLAVMEKYQASPEMFFHRLTNLLPARFNIRNLFFLRMANPTGGDKFQITKELHLSRQHNPHANELNEHYCRRWVSVRILENLKKIQQNDGADDPVLDMQVSSYHRSRNDYVCFSIARHNSPTPETNVSVTLGLLLDPALKRKMKFLDQPGIPVQIVNETCERCDLKDCAERVAPPLIVESKARDARIEEALKFIRQAESEPAKS